MSSKGKRKYSQAMDQAESYEQWKAAAQDYDGATGKDRWRARDQSSQLISLSWQ